MDAIPLNLWAKKINIVLEINIDSYSLADRGESTNDFKTFGTLIKVLFILKLAIAIQGVQKEKERNHLRGSGEIAKKKKDWK